MAEIFTKIKKLVSDDKIEDAIDVTLNIDKEINDHLSNRIIQISSRNRHNNSMFHQAIIDSNSYKLQKNKICSDFLVLIDEIKEYNSHPQKNILNVPAIKLLGESQQNRFNKIRTELVSTDKEIGIVTRDIDENNKKIKLLLNSVEIERLKKENKRLQKKLKKLEKQYQLLVNEHNALKREKEHMEILTKIFAKKDADHEEISKKNRFLEFELEQAKRVNRELKNNNIETTKKLNKTKLEGEQLNNILRNLEEKSIANKSINDKIKIENADNIAALTLVNKDNEILKKRNDQLKYLILTLLALLILSIIF